MNINNIKFYFALLIIICSCTNDDLIQTNRKDNSIQINKKKNIHEIPYAKKSILNKLKKENFVDVELSRKVALLEVQDFKKEFKYSGNKELKLSDRPVVIYDFNNTPKFYEFIVLDEANKEIGTITCFAKKEVPAFIACVLPYVRNYNHKEALLFTAAYPNISPKKIIKGTTSARGLNNNDLQGEDVVSETENKAFWSSINKCKSKVINSTISELVKEQKNNTPRGRAWNTYYTIPSFNSTGLKKTRFSGNCGPTALAWVYRGLYSNYNNNYIPIYGDSNSYNNDDNHLINSTGRAYYTVNNSKLLKDLDEYRGTLLFKNATTTGNMNKAVKNIFPNHKIRKLNKKRGSVRKAIERGNPVYVLIITSDANMHYLVAFGTKKRYTKFWIGGTHLTDSWVLVTDNGATTSGENYLPYYRNSHFLNLRRKTYARGEFIKN